MIHHKGVEMDVKWVSDESHVGVAGRKLDALVVVLERVEDVAEQLFGNATDVVQVHLLQCTVVRPQLLQHLFAILQREFTSYKSHLITGICHFTSSGFTSFGASGSKY